ncbi:MAG: hypothetical protein GX640_07345 [Fibrobacter sp.]|nr:hypothetical protein [Fibrobacter sp.]
MNRSVFWKQWILVGLLMSVTSIYAKTRWSSFHLIPDADLLGGGRFVVESNNFLFSDVNDGFVVRPSAMINIGIIEWVNIQAGYCGGVNLGLKARILGETKPFLPSLAVGIKNVLSHNEAYFFGHPFDSLTNEVYVVLGKSVEPIRLRLHAGIGSIPANKKERFDPFFGFEKFFGNGLYINVELHRRDSRFIPSLFVNYRFFKRHFEFSTGIIDIPDIFRDAGGNADVSFTSAASDGFVRPGIWFGLRFQGAMRFGKSDGFTSLEDRLTKQNDHIVLLRDEIDSLKTLLQQSNSRIESLDRTIKNLADSNSTANGQLKNIVYQKLISLKTLYSQEPFEPELVKSAIRELAANRERIVPILSEIALNRKEDPRVRTGAITVAGEIGSRSAADALIEILGQTQNPDMKIEALIGLGKMKETRAIFLMQQLANDPHDGVAFTAREILLKLERETGIIISSDSKKNPPAPSIAEKKIGTVGKNEIVTVSTVPATSIVINDTSDIIDTAEAITPVDAPLVSEQTITTESVADTGSAIEWSVDSTVATSAADTSVSIQEQPSTEDQRSAESQDTITTDKKRSQKNSGQEKPSRRAGRRKEKDSDAVGNW